MSGMVSGIHIPYEDPGQLLVVPNRKTKDGILLLFEEENHPFEERTVNLVRYSHGGFPRDVWTWAHNMWRKRGERPPKADKLGLPGGLIWEHEIEQHTEEYADYAIVREVVEETGKLIYDYGQKRSRTPLYSRFRQFFSTDFEEGSGKTFERHFFHVHKTRGRLNTEGVKGETDRPEFIHIDRLYPGNFYQTHAYAVKLLLRELIEKGEKWHTHALDHLERTFPNDTEIAKEFSDIRIPPDPTPDLSNDELFAQAMEGVVPIGHK